MRPHRRWLVLAVPVALAAVMLAVPAASSPPSAAGPHVKAAAAAAGHVTAVVHIVQRGLVQDCVAIQNWNNGYSIAGNGVNNPVILTGGGNCFNLLNKFTVGPFGTKTYTGYEYQNGDGHCLFDNGGTIDVGGACQANHPNEEFYGVSYVGAWSVSVVAVDNPNILMATQFSNCVTPATSGHIVMGGGGCNEWQFP